MERLTIDTKFLFCDISQCRETPGGSFCENGYCDQRRVYERLREYERFSERWKLGIEQMDTIFSRINALGGTDLMAKYRALGALDYLTALAAARKEDRVVVLPCKMGEKIYINDSNGNTLELTAVNVAIVDSDGDVNLLDWFGETVFTSRAEAALKGAVENAD